MSRYRSTDDYEKYIDYNPRKEDPFRESLEDRFQNKKYDNWEEDGDWDDMGTEEENR